MAYCSNCGAEIKGAFCSRCGAAGGQAAPAGERRRTSPIVWVLIVILGVAAFGIAALAGAGWYLSRHGGHALASMITAANPNMEVVGTDDDDGTITLRDRRNGKEVTLTFDDVRRHGIRFLAEENGKSASLEIGGEGKLPAWVPAYPGAHAEPVFRARGESSAGGGEAGNVNLTTADPAAQVAEFYQSQAREMGMSVKVTARGAEGRVIAAGDEEGHRGFTAVIVPGAAGTTVNLTYGRER